MDIELINQGINNLKCDGIINITKIDWWLLKYSDTYKQIIAFKKSKYITIRLDDVTISKLSPLDESTEDREFLDLYKRLDTISEFHRNEKYFHQELVEYQKIKNSPSDLKNWVAKNEELGAEKYVCFVIDYLDYSINAEHLKIYLPYLKELEIYIDRNNFKNTIMFLEIFNVLFWVQEILPESLKQIRTEMETTKTKVR